MGRTIIALAVLALAACAAQPETDEQAALAEDGREIAEAQCAGCHAVGQYGESPNPQAPVFRSVLSRYRADVLEEELIQGIQVTHPMPEFQFNPQGADALIAYLQSIQTSEAAR
jgi:mono/diheme cytochrome c family protein